MIDAIVIFFSFYGLTWALQNASILAVLRNWLMRKSVFFFKLLSCAFCTGCHSGWIVYLLSSQHYTYNFFALYALAGGIISLMMDAVLMRLHRE